MLTQFFTNFNIRSPSIGVHYWTRKNIKFQIFLFFCNPFRHLLLKKPLLVGSFCTSFWPNTFNAVPMIIFMILRFFFVCFTMSLTLYVQIRFQHVGTQLSYIVTLISDAFRTYSIRFWYHCNAGYVDIYVKAKNFIGF